MHNSGFSEPMSGKLRAPLVSHRHSLSCVGAACAGIMGFSFSTQRIYTSEDYLLQLAGRPHLEYGKYLFIFYLYLSINQSDPYKPLCPHWNDSYECCYLFVQKYYPWIHNMFSNWLPRCSVQALHGGQLK